MRRLDRNLASVVRDIGREQPLLDQEIDERTRLLRDFPFCARRAGGASGLGIDAGEPGDEPAPKQSETCRVIRGNARIAIGGLQRPLHRRLDRALDAPELLIIGKRQSSPRAKFEIEPLQREGQQGQSVASAAALDVGEQCLRQRGSTASGRLVRCSRAAGPSITA